MSTETRSPIESSPYTSPSLQVFQSLPSITFLTKVRANLMYTSIDHLRSASMRQCCATYQARLFLGIGDCSSMSRSLASSTIVSIVVRGSGSHAKHRFAYKQGFRWLLRPLNSPSLSFPLLSSPYLYFSLTPSQQTWNPARTSSKSIRLLYVLFPPSLLPVFPSASRFSQGGWSH
jgi:hypothetical protein